MKRTIMILAGLFTLGLSVFSDSNLVAAPESTTRQLVAEASEQTQTFSIEKMTCAACPITVTKAMEKVAGVKTVNVDFDAKTATVIFDPAVTAVDEIAHASTNAGYPATPSGEG